MNRDGSEEGQSRTYDVIVVGAGIAGSEIAWASARAGRDVLLVTTSLDTVYNHFGDRVLLDPPDGTLMAVLHARMADEAGWIGTRALHRAAKAALESHAGLHLLQSSVTGLRTTSAGQLLGVSTWEGVARSGRVVALCAGSFLRGRLRVGDLVETAGRLSEMAYDELYDDLIRRGLPFSQEIVTAPPTAGALPYKVTFETLAEGVAEAGSGRVRAIPGLFAAGACARGSLSFEEAAADGVAVGAALVATTASP